jgi:hypothetical protein
MNFLSQLHDNVAEIAIGPSALRNQGAPGVISAARTFLKKVDLQKVAGLSSDSFPLWLDDATDALRRAFPDGAQDSWGAARKGVNLFLRTCLYNTFLARAHGLEKIEALLEIPLDRHVADGLSSDADERKKSLPAWPSIKRLMKSESEEFQAFASVLAAEMGIARVHLDLRYWRKRANKAPEPTTLAVTSRAILRLFEMKQQIPNRDAARAAPARVVAHL